MLSPKREKAEYQEQRSQQMVGRQEKGSVVENCDLFIPCQKTLSPPHPLQSLLGFKSLDVGIAVYL